MPLVGIFPRRMPGARWRILCLLACAAIGRAEAAAAEKVPKILVLYSTRADTELPLVGERDLPRIFQRGLPERVDYYSEFIDAARFPAPEGEATYREFLARKYKGLRFDVVVAVQDAAAQFAARNR